MDWPHRAGRRDNGIDLVAVDRATGENVAIQCKFFDPDRALIKAHIDSFYSVSGLSGCGLDYRPLGLSDLLCRG